MQPLVELLTTLGPAILILYMAYLLVRSFLNKQLEEQRLLVRQKNQEIILPNRLQAYERICLLLERISPDNLIPRLNKSEWTAREFQQVLISEVREEFNHNLSQQVYMTPESWLQVRNAVEGVLTLINEAGSSIAPEENSLALAKKIFDLSLSREKDETKEALLYVKQEVQSLF